MKKRGWTLIDCLGYAAIIVVALCLMAGCATGGGAEGRRIGIAQGASHV